jgi:flagellar basal-body rod protein FlgB
MTFSNCTGHRGSQAEAMKLFEQTRIPLLSKALDAYALRHKAIASNIANVGTPGYRARKVEFEEELSGALRGMRTTGMTTNARHIPIGASSVSDLPLEVRERPETSGGNSPGVSNVDIDQEMAELAQNQIRYRFSARLLADAFRGIQKSIRGSL